MQAELQNARWAMLGVAGILGAEITGDATHPGFPSAPWTEVGKLALPSWTNFGTLITVQVSG